MVASIIIPRIMEIGGGAVSRLPDVLSRIGVRKPLVVTDSFLRSSGTLDRVLKPLADKGVKYGVFDGTVPDPTVEVVEAGVRALQAADYDSMIAIGGGSPIDTAKAVGILAANGGAMRQYKVPNPIPKPGPPLIAVPTTAGTGSEVTKFTIITDTATDEKMLISGSDVVAAAAVVDWELTVSCPLRLTADTGIDSLTHAMEAYVSKKANPFSDSVALSAMSRIARNIRTACFDPKNPKAREEMMLGATLGGLAFSNASVALVHGMSRPIGAHFHVPHGLSNAMLLPAVTRYSIPAAASRYADCARAMGVVPSTAPDDEALDALMEELVALNRDLDVPTPKKYGIGKEKYHSLLQVMAEQAIASGSPGNNPRVPTHPEIVELYKEVWVD
ncbi:iron-containing alcohol dehydrogenase [Hyaloraphidium curvatum]|nr:iron-containing alcohol dehydrogenase [Hyaloraphidium curvatum]